jgi:competence protein ComEC
VYGGLLGRLARGARHFKSALRLHGVVTVALVPLSVAWFSQIPLVGVPANLLAIPWVSLLVTPLVLLGVLLPRPLDAWAFHGAHQLLTGLAAYFDVLRAPPWALWRVASPSPLALVLALSGVLWWLMPRGWPLRQAALLLLTPLLWPYRAVPGPGEFRITVLDVGQGGAALIETATHQMLFDAGPGPESTDAGQRVVVPFLQTHGIEKLDMLMISHGDSDHAGGAAAVLGAVAVARLRASVPPAHRLWQSAQAAGLVDRGLCHAGDQWTWDAVRFEVVWPTDAPDPNAPNRTACVLRVSNAAHAALLPADIEAASERALLARYPDQATGVLAAELLLAPHHGSKTSSTPSFLAAIMPREVVFQVGYRNRFHHPHPSVVARYRARGVTLFRSDSDGEVRFESRQAAFDASAYRTWHRRYWMGR